MDKIVIPRPLLNCHAFYRYVQKKSDCDKVVVYAQTFPLSEIKK
jgi:hypothetical protein